jgi:hypothetical protein
VTRNYHISRDGIEAASKTYIRCSNLLRDEFAITALESGLGPKASFEETVSSLRTLFDRRGTKSKYQAHERAQEEFSFSEVLGLMRIAAVQLAGSKTYALAREDFIRSVNNVLQETGGLRIAKRLVPNATGGRYAWINGHLQTFLLRHKDVVRRSASQHEILIVAPNQATRRGNRAIRLS